MPQATYLEAIRQGIWEEMERDPTVFCIGEDIGVYGGAFKVTDGFIYPFGSQRVIDKPIAESAIFGAAYWGSLTRHRPGGRFPFIGLHQLRLQPDRQHAGQVALPLERSVTAGAARAIRRRSARRPVPFAESRDVVRAHARAESGLPGDRL